MNHRVMIMICAYAPTESGNEGAKDAFMMSWNKYMTLSQTIALN